MKKIKLNLSKKKFTFPVWLKWVFLILVFVALSLGGKSLYDRQQRSKRFELMQKQRQIMMDALKEQGLSDEEIQQKMRESRPTRSPDQPAPEGFNPMRMGGQMRRFDH